MMDGPSPPLAVRRAREKWGRPDADDDADANEQNMRRHPSAPLPSCRPLDAFSPRSLLSEALFLSLTSLLRLLRQVSIVVRVLA